MWDFGFRIYAPFLKPTGGAPWVRLAAISFCFQQATRCSPPIVTSGGSAVHSRAAQRHRSRNRPPSGKRVAARTEPSIPSRRCFFSSVPPRPPPPPPLSPLPAVAQTPPPRPL